MINALYFIALQASPWPQEFDPPSQELLLRGIDNFGESTLYKSPEYGSFSFRSIPVSYVSVAEASRFLPSRTVQFDSRFRASAPNATWESPIVDMYADHWYATATLSAKNHKVSIGVRKYTAGTLPAYFESEVSQVNNHLWIPSERIWLMDDFRIKNLGSPVFGLGKFGPFVVNATVRSSDVEASERLVDSIMAWVRFRAVKHNYWRGQSDGEVQVEVPGLGSIRVLQMASRRYVSDLELDRIGFTVVAAPGPSGMTLSVSRGTRVLKFAPFEWSCLDGTQVRPLDLPSLPYSGELHVSLTAILETFFDEEALLPKRRVQ